MKEECEVRPYRPGDEEEIVELLELVFNGWPHKDLDCSPLDYWRWKFEDNPLKKRFITVAEKDDKIIGCLHVIPLRIKIGSKVFLCSTAVDFAVRPDLRGIGVSGKIRHLSEEKRRKAGVKLDYHITGNPILIKSFLKRKPRFPYNIVNLVRIKDINKQLEAMPLDNAWIIKLAFYTTKFFNDFRNSFIGKSRKHDLNISEIDSFSEKIDDFGKNISNHYDFIVERYREYLNWRYCDPRAGDFVVKQVEENDRILGYSVSRINRYRQNYPIGYIVDLLTLPDRLDVADALVSDAIRYFDNEGINIINYQVVKGHPFESILKRYGFLDSRVKLQLFYTLTSKDDILSKIDQRYTEKTYLSWGDHYVLPVSMPSYERDI